MYKAIGIWTWPADDDLSAFDDHYVNVHYPLATRLPGLRRVTVMRAGDAARESEIFRLAECYWDDLEAFEAASTSPEWAAMSADAMALIERFGVQLKAAHGVERSE